MSYDLIVVGSGNASCGFLSKYLSSPGAATQRILVLEEGQDFFATSDLAHENNWIRSFSQSNIFKLRDARTKNNVPIITARAVCQGGGGSINYTMIHEENEWLAGNIGRDKEYWAALKEQLNEKFERNMENHVPTTAVVKHLLKVTETAGYKQSEDYTGKFPNYNTKDRRAVHRFPTPFNRFGQRTASGVSIVDWSSDNLELRTRSRVVNILFEDGTGAASAGNDKVCVGVQVLDLDTGVSKLIKLNRNGRLLLAAGSSTPQLLLPHRGALNNAHIGAGVSDHILLPLGLYLLPDDMDVVGKDIYCPVFATSEWKKNKSDDERKREYGFDFHSGELRKLIFMLSHLFLALVLPNKFKRRLIRHEFVFRILTNVIRVLLEAFILVADVLRGVYNTFISRRGWYTPIKLITATLKFQPAVDGVYLYPYPYPYPIQLGWFDTRDDAQLAKDALVENIDMLNALGTQPPWIIRKLLWYLVKMPYRKEDVVEYVDNYKDNFLLSQLHLSGGCNIGKALHESDGRVKGSRNVYVADLSAVPLPRVSCQMTAYLMGFHIANAFQDFQDFNFRPSTAVTEVEIDNTSSPEENRSARAAPKNTPESGTTTTRKDVSDVTDAADADAIEPNLVVGQGGAGKKEQTYIGADAEQVRIENQINNLVHAVLAENDPIPCEEDAVIGKISSPSPSRIPTPPPSVSDTQVEAEKEANSGDDGNEMRE